MDKEQLLKQLKEALHSQQLVQLKTLAQQAIKDFPNEAVSHYYRGESLLVAAEIDTAIPFLKKATELEDNFDYNLAYAFALLETGKDEPAKAIFDKLLTQNPNNADLQYLVAMYHNSALAEDKALEHLTKALSIDNNHIDALEMRAYLQSSLGEAAAALKDVDQLLTVNPDNPIWRNMRINLNKKLKNRAGVEADFQHLIAAAPQDIEYRWSLGDYYMGIGEYKEAEYAFSDAIDHEKKYAVATGYSYKKRGNSLLRQQSFYKAIDDFKVAMKLDEEDVDTYLHLAEAYLELEKPDMAINFLEIGLDMDFDARWRLYLKLGEIHLQQEAWLDAEKAFDGMTRETLGKAEGFFQLGLLYIRQGDLEAAFNALKEADDNLHERAEEMMERHCKKFMQADARADELELIAEYEDEFPNNAASATLQKAFGKIWKLDEKTTTTKNAILGQLPAPMKETLLKAFQGMLVTLSKQGLYIFNAGQEATRALYSIESEAANKVEVLTHPFGRTPQAMTLEVNDTHFVLCGIGGGKAALDLYFSAATEDSLPAALQKEWKDKKSAGDLNFLG